ncbi:MAG: DUF2442 domain-containing protein [Cytophagaceae bacterium]|nr:DUF2442 domain-containing protein [Cytophagaceae bacterium]MBK9510142.1 DUF2442 domain-containing protein [Cytophagaceae bacterium]MBL0301271.1 DUF2442 domain-containing protein [Cytophagaceae bacterium]MBL0324088.1 DUF2442 domain-containing protein [Cytophagaceae bacterium]
MLPEIREVTVKDDFIVVCLSDERIVMIPIHWSKKLYDADLNQRKNFVFNDYFIFWDKLDEIIGIKNIIYGQKLWLNN